MLFVTPLLALLGAGMVAAKSTGLEPVNQLDRRQIGADGCATLALNLPSDAELCTFPGFPGPGLTCNLLIGTLLPTVRSILAPVIGPTGSLLNICLCLEGTALSPSSLAILNLRIGQQLGSPTSALSILSGLIDGLLPITVNALLEEIAIRALSANTCVYPDNSIPICSTTPCSFICETGTRRCGNLCLPGAPTDPCPSNIVIPDPTRRRRSVRNDLDCPVGKSACGIPDLVGKFECLDTRFDVESCGGCTFPLPGYQKGVDCTALPNVVDVECVNSRCVIQSCAPGHNFDGLSCVSDGSALGQAALEATEMTTSSGLTGIFIKGLGRVVSPKRAERYKRQEAKAVYAARQASARDVAAHK